MMRFVFIHENMHYVGILKLAYMYLQTM